MSAVPTHPSTLVLATVSGLLLCGAAFAGPLPADAEPRPSAQGVSGWIPLSETELVLSDPRFDPSPDPAALNSAAQLPPGQTGRSGRPGAGPQGLPSGWDNVQGLDSGAGLGGAAVRDALRGFVNVQRASPGAENAPVRRGGPQPDGLGLAGVDLGPAANEWIQETVQGILNSALQLDVNERGQASFSVFGLGDFGVSVSGDRSQVALVSGDDVLLTAQRVQPPAGGPSSGYAGSYGGADWAPGGSYGAAPGAAGASSESPLRQALELAAEIATHPLSLMVYALIGIYALIWSVLSRQARRPRGRPTSQRQWQDTEPIPARKHRVRTRTGTRRRR
jgi:hypothetical protein